MSLSSDILELPFERRPLLLLLIDALLAIFVLVLREIHLVLLNDSVGMPFWIIWARHRLAPFHLFVFQHCVFWGGLYVLTAKLI